MPSTGFSAVLGPDASVPEMVLNQPPILEGPRVIVLGVDFLCFRTGRYCNHNRHMDIMAASHPVVVFVCDSSRNERRHQ